MKIGNLDIKGYAALAPMAGVADRAMREICVRYGAAYTVGELASSKGITKGSVKSEELLAVYPEERPFASQIFGNEPETMAEAAKAALNYNPDFIDINMGCPAPKVALSSKGGSALMKDEKLAGEIVKAVVNAVNVPVTVKMRTGWDDQNKNAVSLAKICEENGASAITVHGRTRSQMYAPPVDIETIAAVKQAVSISVIANGDIVSAKDAAKMYEQTNCDFVMVGRGAQGSPWIFSQINSFLKHAVILPEPPIAERMKVMLEHIKLMEKYKGEQLCYRIARHQTAFYMKGLIGAADLRRKCGTISNFNDCLELCKLVLEKNK